MTTDLNPKPPYRLGQHVAEALADARSVVALETTIYTHGVPRPRNLEVALETEERIRAAGSVPATIGILDGEPVVGLSVDELATLITDDDVVKVSVRDLPVAVASGGSGGTTVAATALLAHRAGIEVFSTGGLGGVHIGAESSFDESADLPALSRIPILVVAAGVKSVLDIRASLERLETLSISVVGYRTRKFPAFYVADSGFELEHAVDGPSAAAQLVEARNRLDLPGAIVVANPVPEDRQLDPETHDRVVAEAMAAAADDDVSGSDATPFMLDYIQRATGGASLEVNLAAYANNAEVGASIAGALAARRNHIDAADGSQGSSV